MGTSTELKRGGQEEAGAKIIAWKFVPYKVRQELVRKLNPDMTLTGNDWRMLAGKLGCTTADIYAIESGKENNTNTLFKHYDTKKGASFNEVYQCLEEMDRQDCLDILNEASDEIEQAWKQGNQPSLLGSSELSDMSPMSGAHYPWTNPSCLCAYPSHSHPSTMCAAHSFCPFTHGYPSCPPNANHHPGTCPSPCHTHSLTAHSHLPHQMPMCPSFAQSPTLEKSCRPSFPPMCQTSPSVNGHMMSTQGASASQARHRNSPGSSRSTPDGHNRTSPRAQSSMFQGRADFNEYPAYTFGSTEQMAMNDLPLPNNISAVDNSNLHSTSSSNESIAQRQKVSRQYSDESNMSQNCDKRLRHNSHARSGLNSPLDLRGGGLGAYGGEVPNHFHLPNRVEGTGVRPRANQSPKALIQDYLNYRDAELNQESKPVNGHALNGLDLSYNNSANYHSQGSTDSSCEDIQELAKSRTSLDYLQKLAAVPDRYQPTNEYKTVVAEQKIESEKANKATKDSMDSSSHVSSLSSGSSSSGKSRPSSTFPMRVKVKHEKKVDDLASLTISKSTSMPQNMKPKEYRKAFRNIKVFVTYSHDNDTHGKQVLSLCKFLQSNGFACCVDVNKKASRAHSPEDFEWCRRKFKQADFILACISPKYLQDTHSPHPPNYANERCLHTREIYELMNAEYLHNEHGDVGNKCQSPLPRFIPLLFGDLTSDVLPRCMMNGPVYSWPKQFLDLAWVLTKPQERIRARRQAMEEAQACGEVDMNAHDFSR